MASRTRWACGAAMALIVLGIAGGPVLETHRSLLGLYLTSAGVAFFIAVRAMSQDDAHLVKSAEAHAKWRPFKGRQPDSVQLEVERQRQMMVWVLQPAAVLFAVCGLVVLVQSIVAG